jgi:hypothetical protein
MRGDPVQGMDYTGKDQSLPDTVLAIVPVDQVIPVVDQEISNQEEISSDLCTFISEKEEYVDVEESIEAMIQKKKLREKKKNKKKDVLAAVPVNQAPGYYVDILKHF